MTLPGPTPADTRARFLASITEVVPAERLAEIHFFPPIRQGPVETGVAVVGAERGTASGTAATEDATPYRDPRHIVFMARYRWTRKGPERGKWESEVIAEADAPLVTVEAVAKGVRDRANEAADPDRMDGDQARAILAELEHRRTQAAGASVGASVGATVAASAGAPADAPATSGKP
jgi:hypothetical protein